MAHISGKEKNFKKFIERHFGITLPEGVQIFYAKGVRVGNTDITRSQITGELGYAACDFGFNPTNPFIQNFGHLATRNVVKLKEESEARAFAAGKDLAMNLGAKSKQLIMRYKEYTVGLGYYDAQQKKVKNQIPKKRTREIINEL
ncbi:MAG: hypothetical protein PHV13_05335 [Candidatus ainarchaeum sp.]|nr:hypothetical protein [Candidatus ainarchaeum sp.]